MDYENELRVLAPKQKRQVYKSYNWIVKVIDSCTNSEHIPYCEILIDKFYRLHGVGDMASSLSQGLFDKREQILKAGNL